MSFRSKALALGLFAALFSAAGPLAASEPSWSFEEHPQPYGDQLAPSERDLLRQADDLDWPRRCPARLQAAFAIYKAHYPDYAAGAPSDVALKRWMDYMVSLGSNDASGCVVGLLEVAIDDLLFDEGPFPDLFCGKLAREPASEAEQLLSTLLAKMTEYAETLNRDAVEAFLRLGEDTVTTRFNPDIRYFLERTLAWQTGKPLSPEFREIVIADMGQERFDEVEKAYGRNDLRGVIETSPECTPWSDKIVPKEAPDVETIWRR
ncbi:hypothetical protein [Martelella radicis]|uniref:Uncharacterized protein n=1 Tax=Martelella radicis TaxID=1397476 RepID=A0A7W6KLQ0_9HYPH|nr:hypothetical protein [Martelella radicis]MBB4122120.1 hypothetical protein [Martelella radicis]